MYNKNFVMKTKNYSLRSCKSLSQSQWPAKGKKFQNCEINLILLASRTLKGIYYLSGGIQRFNRIWKEEKVNPLLSNAFASCVVVARLMQYIMSMSFADLGLGLISATFYFHLLCVQISKAQKNSDCLTEFIMLLGATCVKAVCKMLVKLITGVDFSNNLCPVFTHADPKGAKHSQIFNVVLSLWDLCM